MVLASSRELLIQDVKEAWVDRPSVARRTDPISRAIALLLARPESRMLYVLDQEDRLVGTVSFRNILKLTNARMGVRQPGVLSLVELFRNLMPERVEQIMRKPTPVRGDDPIAHALLLMDQTQQNDLPIVDAEGRLVGEVNGMHILGIAHRVFHETEQELVRQREQTRNG